MSDRREKKERRTSNSRRRSRERKRAARRAQTVIEIAGTDLRVVTLLNAEGAPDQVRALTVPWRNEATNLNSEQGLEELTRALTELTEKLSLQATRLQFVLSGEFCVTKALRGTIEEVNSEMQQIEQRSRLYLMLGPGEKVTVSRTQPIDARHVSAVLSVCNQKTLDTIHMAASRAGLQIDSIEPALVSTSRAIGRLENASQEPCLLIHLDEASAELGVCHRGNLLLDYRPGGRTDPEDLVNLVRTHLSRLQRHVGRQLQEPPAPLRRIYLCGKQSAVAQAFPVFASCEQFDVEIIQPENIQATWEFSEPLESSEAVPALGALLSTYLPSSEQNAPNFMQHILASTREPLQPILVRSLIPFAAVLLVAMTLFAFNYSSQQAGEKIQLQLAELTHVQSRELELRLQRTRAELKLVQLKALSDGMPAMPAGEVIARIGHCMPSDVWLNHLEIFGKKKIQITGASYLEEVVDTFVNWLELAPGFEDVALRSTRPGHSAAGPTVNFNVELNIGDWEGHVEEVASNE